MQLSVIVVYVINICWSCRVAAPGACWLLPQLIIYLVPTENCTMRALSLLLILALGALQVASISQTCGPDALDCPLNSFCNPKSYCQCEDGWVLDCSVRSHPLSDKPESYVITREPTYFTIVPSGVDSVFIYRFNVCGQDEATKVGLNFTLFADEGTQAQFTEANKIGQVVIEAKNQCSPLFSPYMQFGQQPNGRIQQMVLMVTTTSVESFLNIRVGDKGITVEKVNLSSDQQKSTTILIDVTEIHFIDLDTLKYIIFGFVSLVSLSLLIGVAYCIYAIKFGRRAPYTRHNNTNNLDHFDEYMPKIKLEQNDERLELECIICLVPFDVNQEIRNTECNHVFHQDCLDAWCKTNLTCPVCRNGLTKQDFMARKRSVISNASEMDTIGEGPLEPPEVLSERKTHMRTRLIA